MRKNENHYSRNMWKQYLTPLIPTAPKLQKHRTRRTIRQAIEIEKRPNIRDHPQRLLTTWKPVRIRTKNVILRSEATSISEPITANNVPGNRPETSNVSLLQATTPITGANARSSINYRPKMASVPKHPYLEKNVRYHENTGRTKTSHIYINIYYVFVLILKIFILYFYTSIDVIFFILIGIVEITCPQKNNDF